MHKPRRGAAARHAAQPARRDRRIRAARIRGLCGEGVVGGSRGRRHGRKARGVGWGRGELAEQPPHHPTPEPSGQPRGTWRGGPGYREEGTHAGGRRHRARGRVAGRPRPGGNGGAEGPAAGGGARAGKQAEENPPLPTRSPHSATPPPPHLSRAAPRPQKHRGVAPNRPRPPVGGGAPSGRVSFSPPLPSSRPIPRRTGGREAREPGGGGGAARPPRRSRNRPR